MAPSLSAAPPNVFNQVDAQAVDATCGNGKDSLFLSKLIQDLPSDDGDATEAELICIDQREAIELLPQHLERRGPLLPRVTEQVSMS
ncbi:unnamed protein product [Vitrella brassicaformis CCMP3155]|uniref:Uncharacterized protein n=1 Tax=Vitrella brassicaformis (strain CCMP3155) TaxID=1169540 RepID=A0A0G4GRA2_VITBC|nr:unnamed protein product [Vitrella brassicaformis CCMP3155]|eukprot:CEM33064.1 unnamed protein product [Vitrella brassicaformis CCMP3155]